MVKKLEDNVLKSINEISSSTTIERTNGGFSSYADTLKFDSRKRQKDETSFNDHATNNDTNLLLNEFVINVSQENVTHHNSKINLSKQVNRQANNDLNVHNDFEKRASIISHQLKSKPATQEVNCCKRKIHTQLEEFKDRLDQIEVTFFIKNIIGGTLDVEFEEKSLKFKFKTTDNMFIRTHYFDFDQLKANYTKTRITNGTINGAPTAENQFSALKPEIDHSKLPLFKYEIKQLFDKIIPGECSYELSDKNLMIKLKKKTITTKWDGLEMVVHEMGTNFLKDQARVDKANDPIKNKLPTTNGEFRNVSKLITGYEKITNNAQQQVDTPKDAIPLPPPLSALKNCKPYRSNYSEPKKEVDEQMINNLLISPLREAEDVATCSTRANRKPIPLKFDDDDSSPESKPSLAMNFRLNLAESKGKIGYTGLSNLGNTCYMNSCLQCLSNTAELRDYFLSEQYKEDLNRENPFGSGGNLAEAFSEVLYKLWSSDSSYFSPQRFKRLIDENCSQFAGYSQHDSVEFMEHFLDVLHEDLNKVDRKNIQPAEQIENEDELNDEQLADEQWRRYKERNDSVMTKLFYGQYKSKLVCPTCSKVSIVFDPFLYLPIPLTKNKININYYLFTLEHDKPPKRMSCQLPQGSKILNLFEDITNKTGLQSSELIACQINQSGDLEQEYKRTLFISDHLLKSKKIYVYQKPVDRDIYKSIVHQTIQDINIQSLSTSDNALKCEYCNRPISRAFPEDIQNCPKCKKVLYCKAKCREEDETIHQPKCKNDPVVVGWPSFFFFDRDKITYDELMNELERLALKSCEVTETEIDDPQDQSLIHQSDQVNVGHEMKEGQFDLEMKELQETVEKDVEDDAMNVCTQDGSTDSLLPNASTSTAGENGFNRMHDSNVENDAENQRDSKYRFVLRGKKEELGESKQLIYVPKNESDEEQKKFRESLGNFYYLYVDWKQNYSRIDANGQQQTFALSIQSRNLNLIATGDDLSRFGFEETKNEIRLEDLMTKFTEPETLSTQDSWVCPKCKEPRTATKELSIWRPPQILIIQLKRFSYSSYAREKIDKLVSYPIKGLNISKFCADSKLVDQANKSDHIYDLYAVIQHFGNLYGGHYTAIANSSVENRELGWRAFNDSSVRDLDQESTVSRSAYVLFYRLRDSSSTARQQD